MKLPSRKILIGLGAIAALLLIAVLALPFLIDVDSYRGVIQSKAEETLGREVELGELGVSFFPLGVRVDSVAIGALPEEGGGDLLTARKVRVGARLMPLLGKRLEVTTITIEEPTMTLVRGNDGRWNVQRLIVTNEDAPAAPSTDSAPAAEFVIGSLRLTGGRVEIRDSGPDRRAPVTLVLDDIDVRARDLALDRPFEVELSANLEGEPTTRIELSGRAGPLARAADAPLEVSGTLSATDIDPARIEPWLPAPLPGDLSIAGPFSVSATMDASVGAATRVALSDVSIRDLDVSITRDRDGGFGLAPAVDTDDEAPEGPSSFELTLDGLEIADSTFRLTDESLGESPVRIALVDLDATIDRLPIDGPASLEARAGLHIDDEKSTVEIRGSLGPVGETTIPVDIEIDVAEIPLAPLSSLLGDAVDLAAESGLATISTSLSGRAPSALDARGSVQISDARVGYVGPDGERRSVPIDLAVRYDMGIEDQGARTLVRDLRVDLAGNSLGVKGSIEQQGDSRNVDLELLPSRVMAEDIRRLMALVAIEPPIAFSSGAPIEIAARIRGIVGPERMPDVSGTARLQQFTLNHSSLTHPIEQVGAEVRLEGKRIEVRNFGAVVGSSDIAGDVTVQGFGEPKVTFDLRSRNADFGELFSFLQQDAKEDDGGPAETPSGKDPLAALEMRGDLRIDTGSFQTLDFSDLTAHMTFIEQVLTLDPVDMVLYDGRFGGRIVSDLGGEAPTFRILGDARTVDVNAFLVDNLDLPETLAGRFTGRVETEGAGADYETIVRSLHGTGSMQVDQGTLGKLNLLGTVSSVSGVFGESTVRQLSNRLATDGTAFDAMSGKMALDGGKMQVNELLFRAPEFSLTGDGIVDLLSSTLAGEFRLSLSPEISRLMRTEDSRAADLFYNSRTRQVELPFTLEGPFQSPRPGIDFESIARDRVEERVTDLIRDRLGLGDDEPDDPPAPQPSPQSVKQETGGPAPATPQPSATGLAIDFTEIDWRGAFLAPDLQVSGTISGPGIGHAALTLTDSRGREFESYDRLEMVDAFLAGVADRSASSTIPWLVDLDGKRILGAAYPLTVTVTVFNLAGESHSDQLSVDRR